MIEVRGRTRRGGSFVALYADPLDAGRRILAAYRDRIEVRARDKDDDTPAGEVWKGAEGWTWWMEPYLDPRP